MAYKVNKRVFKKLEDGKFEISENRDLSFPVDPVDVIVNLKNMKADIEKLQKEFPLMIKKVKGTIENYNKDLETMQEAKKVIKFEAELPEFINEKEELDKFDISKID